MRIIERSYRENDRRALLDAGIHPLLAKIYAARSIRSAAELTYTPAGLLPPTLKGLLRRFADEDRIDSWGSESDQ